MTTSQKLLLSFALAAGSLAAQNPSITGIVNPASNIPPGFSNYGIALGSVFAVYGTNLGPAAITQESTPQQWPTTLAGTSISITVNGTTVSAPMYFAWQGTLGAVMPSNTPIGTGTLKVTYNGNSGSAPITVVQSNFGILSSNYGSGAAVVTDANYANITVTNSAKPLQAVILWGTGLGPITGNDAALPTGGDLGTPITVWVGGVQANLIYRGRSGLQGLDQINFIVPQNAPLGCNVSIIVQTTGAGAGTVSNGPTMAIAPNGGPCLDPTQYFPASLSSKSSAKVMYLKLKQTSNLNFQNGSPVTSTSANVQVGFLQFTQSQLTSQAPSFNTESSFGSCFTEVVPGSGSGSGAPTATYLNAGTSLTLTPFRDLKSRCHPLPRGAPLFTRTQT